MLLFANWHETQYTGEADGNVDQHLDLMMLPYENVKDRQRYYDMDVTFCTKFHGNTEPDGGIR